MSGVGLEVFLEGLIPEIAYSGEKGVSISELLKIVRQYHLSLGGQDASIQGDAAAAEGLQQSADDADLEKSLTAAEMSSARWAWDWLRSRPQILINGNKRWNRLELSEALALPEADLIDPTIVAAAGDGMETDKGKGKKSKKTLTTRPRIHPSEDLVWQTLTRHGVDYKRVPALEWACLQGIASARAEGILQSDLRRLVDQDKRSLPKRTDSLARKGYVAKRTVVVQKMKTSRLWLIDFAPPLVEEDKCGLDLTPETLSKDLEPVPWHKRWSENNIDMDALGRTVVGVVKAFHVIRYADLRLKMGVSGKRWQMKTLAKNCQRLVDVGVLKYTAASFAESRKVFKDCLKFVREPTAEEWDKFLATGKKTSLYSDPTRHREPKPHALALYGKSGEDGQGTGAARSKLKRIFSGWIPEKPLAQTVFEVIRRAGPEGASNPQVSVATVGYQHRRYLSSYLTKVAETQQPQHLSKFQVDSKLVRTGKTSAYMFSAPRATEQAALPLISEEGSSDSAPADPYGFGAPRPKAFSAGQDFSLSDMSKVAKKSRPSTKRKLLPRVKPQHLAAAEAARAAAFKQDTAMAAQGDQSTEPEGDQGLKRTFDEITGNPEGAEDGVQEEAPSSTPTTTKEATRGLTDEDLLLNVRYNGLAGKLQVHREDRHVTFLRSGRGLKKPFIIPVDDNLDEPAIRDVPGSEEKSLVLATGEKDGKPAWTSVFIFDDEGQDNAVWIQQEIIKMKSPDYEPSFPEIPDASEEITVGLAPPGAARGKASGRGGSRAAGRGKGKKGRNLPAGAKPYVCALCGNAWKNDIGLKYHLEKAQVPCNPNFDPAILLERARKRRKPSPTQPSVANSEAGDDGLSGRTLKPRGGRKGEKKAPRLQLNVRIAMRSAQDPAHKFRGLSATDDDNLEEPESWVSERPKEAFRSTASVHTGEHTSGPVVRGPTGNNLLPVGLGPLLNVGSRPSIPMGMASYPGPVSSVENGASRGVLAAIDQGASGMVARVEQSEPLPSLPTAPATPTRSRASEDAPPTSDKTSYHNTLDDFTLRPTNGTPLYNRHADISPSRAARQQEPYQSEYPDLAPQQMEQEPEDEFGTETTMSQNAQRISKPFVRSSNYERMASEAKRRTAQAFDIIAYLLDNNLGVFPGDKALFYALTNVFLKEFPKQMPPTWKNFTGAVKAVESRKLAAVHTHMLKTERGRLQTCTLLIRTGVDPNGIIATKMKQKMRETYPGIFIPPAFSPTQDELVLLQELDKKVVDTKPNANGQKFRSRRKIEEIETFNAPYYKNTAPVAAPKRDPLWIRETERLFDDGYTSQKRSAGDDDSAGPLHKRARNGFPDDEYGDIPVDPEILGDPMSPSQQGQREGPSVLEAIKAYSLLPAKLGPRGRRRPSFSYKPLAKLPRELGRIKNPGLGSLPDFFFGRNANTTAIQFVSPEVLILDPNTNLDEDHDGDEEDQGQSQSQGSSRESSEDALDRPGVGEGSEDTETTTEGAKTFNFAWPAVLEPSPEGCWLDHPLKYFENHDGSFTVNGWMPTQTWLLTQNIPSSAEEMAGKQRAKKIKLRGWVDREYARFCSVINQCAAWEQSRPGTAVMSGSRVVPDYYFINVSSPASRASSRAVSLKWSDETQYDLETLPYEELEDDDYGDVIYIEDGAERTGEDGEPSPKRRRGVQKTAAGQPKRTKGGRPPKLKLAAIKTMREHTSYPKTADDLLRQDDNDDLDWSSENVRLAAFIVVTTLLGGVDKVVDWGLMLRLMPNQTISQLRHYWCALKKDRLSTIVSLTDKFRRAFLKAYEKNEVPPIDFNNVLAYDWKFIIKWTTKLDMAERLTLPSTRKALDKTITVTKFKHGNRPWREAFYHPQRSIFNKFQDATSESLAYSVDDIPDPKPSTEMIVAMSWTRSLCVTPVEAYTADAVLHKRNSLFPSRTKTEITELMVEGVDQLQRQAVISKSSSKWSNGRRWRFNTRVLDAIEKAAQQEKFAKAVQFKKELDQAFRAGEKKRVTYITNDGMVMALINMQASGRVRVETTGQPHVPMGHEPGNYETRKYTKKYMHFRLDIVPTESYLYDDEEREDTTLSDLRSLIKHTPPPTTGPGGAVPVWCDVFGKVDAERWLKYLSAVLITLASRGSMRAAELAETLKPVIMEFEAELIMEWAGRLGLLRAQFEGAAPAVMEWWWIVVGVQREGLVEAAAAAKVARQRKALPSGRPSAVAGGGGGGKGVEGGSRGVEGVDV